MVSELKSWSLKGEVGGGDSHRVSHVCECLRWKAELFSVSWGQDDVILMLQCAQEQCPSPVGSVAPAQARPLNLNKIHKKIHVICVPRYINNYFSWKSFPPAFSSTELHAVF